MFFLRRDSSVNSLANGCIFIDAAKWSLAINENPGSISVPTMHGKPRDSATFSIFFPKCNPQDFAILIFNKSAAL